MSRNSDLTLKLKGYLGACEIQNHNKTRYRLWKVGITLVQFFDLLIVENFRDGPWLVNLRQHRAASTISSMYFGLMTMNRDIVRAKVKEETKDLLR